jgi:hypothetical protein
MRHPLPKVPLMPPLDLQITSGHQDGRFDSFSNHIVAKLRWWPDEILVRLLEVPIVPSYS